MDEITRAASPLDVTFSDAELERQREHVTSFIADTYEAAGADAAVICLSGGVDSTLTAYLAVEALGPEQVYGLVLPSTVNPDRSTSDGELVAGELLGIEHDVVDIYPLVEGFLDAHPAVGPDDIDDERIQTAVGNLRARIRAVFAYFAANRRNGLVLGTGNRSEAAVGYFTKYGDGAVDCHPLGNLYKQQVRQLADHVGVPERLATKTASAELWENHTDERELGVGYNTLDSVLALHVDGPLSAHATAAELGVDEELVDHVRDLYAGSRHKRRVPPAPEPLT